MQAFVCRNSLNKSSKEMLTCFASTNERLVKNVAVAAALDTCEGTQQVSGATDAELRTSNLAALAR